VNNRPAHVLNLRVEVPAKCRRWLWCACGCSRELSERGYRFIFTTDFSAVMPETCATFWGRPSHLSTGGAGSQSYPVRATAVSRVDRTGSYKRIGQVEIQKRHPTISRRRFTASAFVKNRSGLSDDLFPFCVPLDGTFLTQRSDSHLAGNGGTEAEIEGAVRLFAAADTIKEVTHVGVGV
jgi:hypothetical protein